ncbi:hypothetical protein [Lysobacter xanthus]
MKSVPLLAALLAAVVPCAASAAELSHNYVEVGVARQHQDVPASLGGDADFDGAYLRGSAAFGDTGFYGFGAYRQGRSDSPFGGLDASDSQLGVGYAYRVAPRVELLGEGSYLRRDFEGFTSETWRASAGTRAAFGERVEGWAKANYSDRSFGGSRYSAELGGEVKINERWGVTGALEHGDDVDTYTLGMRASF